MLKKIVLLRALQLFVMNIVVTGASKGLGKTIAEKFAGDGKGHSIFLCARNKTLLEKTGKEIQRKWPENTIHTLACDISKKEGATEFWAFVRQKVRAVDILVNNAGSFVPGSVHDEPNGALEEMIANNLYSAYYLTRFFLPTMMEALSGHIFNMCSIASLKAYEAGGSYSISKFALLGMTKNLREEMKPYNIKVTAVLPGAAYTDSWAASGIDPKRIMEANDIAELVYTAAHLSPQACVEEIIVRPQLGDV
jgi:short-subunit dehydrogenase